MKTKNILMVVSGVMMITFLWAVQVAPNANQPNYNGNIVVPQGNTGSTGSVGYTGTTRPMGVTGTTGFTGSTGTRPGGTIAPGTVPGTVPGPTGFTGYTGGPPR